MASFMTCSENQPRRKSALCWELPGQRKKKKGVSECGERVRCYSNRQRWLAQSIVGHRNGVSIYRWLKITSHYGRDHVTRALPPPASGSSWPECEQYVQQQAVFMPMQVITGCRSGSVTAGAGQSPGARDWSAQPCWERKPEESNPPTTPLAWRHGQYRAAKT